MYRRMSHGRAVRVIQDTALAGLLGLYAVGGVAQTKAAKTVPDAQVEANVLKALATEPDLANQPITTTTVYGVVTLSGSVQTEAMRTKAETIASRSSGVQKVVDEMTLTADSANVDVRYGDQAGGGVLQSHATIAPAPSAEQKNVPPAMSRITYRCPVKRAGRLTGEERPRIVSLTAADQHILPDIRSSKAIRNSSAATTLLRSHPMADKLRER